MDGRSIRCAGRKMSVGAVGRMGLKGPFVQRRFVHLTHNARLVDWAGASLRVGWERQVGISENDRSAGPVGPPFPTIQSVPEARFGALSARQAGPYSVREWLPIWAVNAAVLGRGSVAAGGHTET